MILIDTSVWIEIFRDKTGNVVKAFQKAIGAENYAISRFQQLELLQVAADEKEWGLLEKIPFDPILSGSIPRYVV